MNSSKSSELMESKKEHDRSQEELKLVRKELDRCGFKIVGVVNKLNHSFFGQRSIGVGILSQETSGE